MRNDDPKRTRQRPPEFDRWSDNAKLVFEERMGNAEQLNMPTEPGSRAWEQAFIEAKAENAKENRK